MPLYTGGGTRIGPQCYREASASRAVLRLIIGETPHGKITLRKILQHKRLGEALES